MISGLLCSNSLSVCIGKFHKIFLYLMYHFLAFSNHHFSHSFPWITFATLSCPKFSYTMCYLGSFGDKVCHCLTSVPHNRHKEDTSPYTTFLMSFVHNAWSSAAVIALFVTFFSNRLSSTNITIYYLLFHRPLSCAALVVSFLYMWFLIPFVFLLCLFHIWEMHHLYSLPLVGPP